MISSDILLKKEIIKNLLDMFTNGLYKYIKHIYKKKSMEYPVEKILYQKFQKKLYKITKWSEKTLEREYKNFMNWCQKHYSIDRNELDNQLKSFVLLSVQIMINKSKIYTQNFLSNYEYPNGKSVYYKLLKRVARIYYENPKSFEQISSITLKENIEPLFYNFIPINKISSFLETNTENNVIPKKAIEFSFGGDYSDTSSNNSISEKISIKDRSDKELKYISSDEFKIFTSEESENKQNTKLNSKIEDEENVKQIRLPKLNYYKQNMVDHGQS